MSSSQSAIRCRRVGIIGAGHVGSHVAYALAAQGIADEILLADCNTAKAESQAMDIQDAAAYLPHRVVASACTVEQLSKGCDVIVLSAGPLPLLSESRLDTLPRTMEVLKDITKRLNAAVMPTFTGMLVCISNPADVVAAYMQQALRLPPQRVICTGTALDSARLQAILTREVKCPIAPASLRSAYMLGEHGDSCVVAWSHVMIATKPLDELQREKPEQYPSFDRDAIQEEVHRRGYQVLTGKGSTEFGIGTACAEIIRAIFHNEHKVIPCSVALAGQYGQHDVFASVPAVIGSNGVEGIIELHLTDAEKKGFDKSCDVIRSYMKQAFSINPVEA